MAIRALFFTILMTALSGCTTGKPETITPVSSFDLNKYLGTWYEIARLDHSFERNLDHVTATYSMNDDGSVKVINKGLNTQTQQWKEAVGKAKFVQTQDIGYLKVSFFGPFYGSYIIFYLEPDYSTALISSYNYDYLWLLSRHKQLSKEQRQKYLMIAKQAGFDTAKLIFPTQ
ncbi:lipocalin family protein [Photobacterium lucens]|uniref:lipocalin family protein n=1 Tax=Photobacterium lucens TaxID=2562949 RepID=UPI0006B6057F|nr:lipocalin family protein [Photobacterium lucens]KPA52380.1 lipocalin [Photobacterium leiognathi subsp. mandapamensis]MBP2700635.1 lipocalin [Vibrio parahaemolyticus]MZG56655.1 lipocalin [Photobacterium lucens]MZG81094.1 lipocalin [Photobacterium lucens]